ncbi:hypothetical protein [Bordetella genomosp. 11]|uniref:hypothetical protein n=1 Tax=Bordetella genomosp. 11 TaxID=1416808 RepID=UPI0015960FC9|nr:hypothetical protein [Bordetella genomosp. 11]
MAANTCEVTFRMAWWWRWYASGVILTAALTGLEPDADRATAVARRAIRIGRPFFRATP